MIVATTEKSKDYGKEKDDNLEPDAIRVSKSRGDNGPGCDLSEALRMVFVMLRTRALSLI